MGATQGTRASLTAVLERQYLGPIRSSVNSGTPLLDKLVKRTTTGGKDRARGLKSKSVKIGKGWGEMLTFDIHVGPNFGVGARAGTHGPTTGYVPDAGSQDYIEGQILAAHYWGHAQLQGNVLDADGSLGSGGLDILDAEMRRLPFDIRRQKNIDLYGDGTGKLADVTSAAGSPGTVIPVSDTRAFLVNQPIVVAGADGTAAVLRTITAINRAGLTITVNTSTTFSGATDIFRQGIHNTNVSSEYGNALAGLELIVSASSTYAGLNRSLAANAGVRSQVMAGIAQASFSLDYLEQLVHDCNRQTDVGSVDLIVCDLNLYNLLKAIYRAMGQWTIGQKKLLLKYPALWYDEQTAIV